MVIMTNEIEKRLENFPIGSQDDKGMDAEIIVKYFTPIGSGTWLITEGVKTEGGDWELFGYCHILEWEWGYVMLSELESISLPFGIGVERDRYLGNGRKVREVAKND